MSESDDPGAVRKALRTVSPAPRNHSDPEMNTVGLGIAVGILLLLLPLLPFLLIIYALVTLADFLRRQAS